MSQKPLPEPSTRLDLTKKLIAGANIPKAPPKGFKPIEATPDELKSYGLPPKPDAKTDPGRYARWSKHLSKPLTFVAPTFKIIEKEQDPTAKTQTKAASSASSATSSNWSGVVIADPSPAKQYTAIEGEWIVPNAYPSAGNGDYDVSVWVGIDGWGNGEVVQSGTDSYVSESGGKITSQGVYGWFEWFPAYAVAFGNFSVHGGDTVWGYVDVESPTEAYAFLYNVGAGTYASAYFPKPSTTTFIGATAEWIVENPDVNNVETLFPDFGSTVFFDTYAYSGAWQNLSNGGITVTLVESGNTLDEVIDETSTSFIVVYV